MSNEFLISNVEGTDADRKEVRPAKETPAQSQASTSHNDGPGKWHSDEELITELKKNDKTGEHCINVKDSTEIGNDSGEGSRKPKIQKAPESMLKNGDLKECFKPGKLSIGPIHAADPKFFDMKFKLQLAAHFGNESDTKVDELLEKFKKEIKNIKAYFDENDLKDVHKSYTEEELIRSVFLDGCATLGFIDCYVNNKLNMFGISNDDAASIQQDLFLLENQVPFAVLKVLMGFQGRKNKKLIRDFCRFIDSTSTLHGDLQEFKVDDLVMKDPVHILDLLREVLLSDKGFHLCWVLSFTCCLPCFICCPLLLCCYLEWYFQPKEKKKRKQHCLSGCQCTIKQHPIRSVQELKKTGIEFKPSDSLRSASFRYSLFNAAQLELPRLVVDKSTKHKLVNLVAYEMRLLQSDSEEQFWVTSYVSLLGFLIQNEQDIKDLREVGILRITHLRDIEVVQLIKSISSSCSSPQDERDPYKLLKDRIASHCKSRCRRSCAMWMGQGNRTYFSSPWSIIALIAATAVLALTIVQTWYAVNPKS